MGQIVVIGSPNRRELIRLLFDGLVEVVFLRGTERIVMESATKCVKVENKGPRDKYGRVK